MVVITRTVQPTMSQQFYFTLYRVILLTENCTESMIDHELIRNSKVNDHTYSTSRSVHHSVKTRNERNVKPLSATDVLAPTTMKNAAKCDTSCELQNPVSHQNFERNLHFLWKYVCWSVCSIPTSSPVDGPNLAPAVEYSTYLFMWSIGQVQM